MKHRTAITRQELYQSILNLSICVQIDTASILPFINQIGCLKVVWQDSRCSNSAHIRFLKILLSLKKKKKLPNIRIEWSLKDMMNLQLNHTNKYPFHLKFQLRLQNRYPAEASAATVLKMSAILCAAWRFSADESRWVERLWNIDKTRGYTDLLPWWPNVHGCKHFFVPCNNLQKAYLYFIMNIFV